ncbi:hypothetical protein CVO77_13385 [Sphingopyxis lindanitolerans]|uniref:Uncharacterized protein n=2 Tax=Sphingopyxis lindanitolerans TaxID=2054227 RepID=A0A2S8B102_9SPHN|nr:hypothetical protein CVO77_13385 [Sphingopyxis lindanitolerans]
MSKVHLPRASVSPDEYPALLTCTLEKRSGDIEAILVARQKLDLKVGGGSTILGATLAQYEELEVETSDGRRVRQPRLLGEIITSCHEFKDGHPLGFDIEMLVRDWKKAMSFGYYGQLLDEHQFAKCLVTFRPTLVTQYMRAANKSEASGIYAGFFEQPICKTEQTVNLKEGQVRSALKELTSN